MVQENYENHINIKIQIKNHETHENLGFPLQIIKSNNLKTLCKNNENHLDLRNPREIHENYENK